MNSTDQLALLDTVLSKAKAAGADAADAVIGTSISLSLGERLGAKEKLERAEAQDLGLRVFVGKRQAIVSTSDFTKASLEELTTRAVAMAKVVPEDPHCGLAGAHELAKSWPKLDLCDATEPSEALLTDLVRAAEDAARSVKGVTNSEGAEAGYGRSDIAIAASNGFQGAYASSHFGLSVSVLAGEGTGMERDYDYSSTVYLADLDDPVKLGKAAGERAVKRLNPRKAKTAVVPIILDPRISNSIVGHLVGAINGAGIARGTSFLKDFLGKDVFAPGIDIIDDPHRQRGLRSRPFDGEGLATSAAKLIDNGRLTMWLLDCRSARQLGLTSNGHASRGTSSPPSPAPSNVHMAAGKISRAQMIKEIDQGLYVTEMIGSGVNGVTGDYSRGAAGFWIEKGEITYPVSEVTIAGNLKDMFKAVTPADDLVFKYGTNAPTLRIDGMTLAGA
ncbi:TldD/PmbA family protein [Dongia rigui]|uniref:TldD/PmbA family protein n=1 Tax=Dongia rigui TaxID=940149 RepID=A0ABU5DW60_9PROT|nr:TldD/PmbA family protein [Dongia rigui]MDY0871544.1 TldD/PmbA family protein [Dongia rigui]